MRASLSYGKFVLLLSFGLFVACATLPSMNVTYRTMPQSNILEGRGIYFRFIDKRSDKDIIGEGAKEIYKYFTGSINFIVSKGKKDESFVGIYEAESLFKDAFSIYLENMGLRLLPEPKPGIPELSIKLHDFVLDLSGRRWVTRIEYEAEFIHDGDVLIREFRGEGEKLRISGLTQADQVVSETFTDIVNQLDVKRMFGRK
ncbi:MAG: hypothetical protein HWN70_04735 [Desulfobacterales bacterium]|nr:hypothetical protein [Desulfobacterales bacterium]